MVRRLALLALCVTGLTLPLLGTVSAQETSCASSFWLEQLATAEAAPSATAWMNTELTDACSGETFSLTDFAGKTIYVEAMATWCPSCRDQLGRVSEAAAQIPEAERGDTVFVALSTETDLPRETLAQYAADNEFPLIFAVMPAEMLQTMAEGLGQEIAVPPATPHVIVAPDGTVGALRTGAEAAEDLLALLAEAGETSGS